jgi:GrpB-like predicted nucleotidyltransferase (UPF0157 family)
MSNIELKPADDLFPVANGIINHATARLKTLFPEAEVHHIGATAVCGALTKGDVDVLVRVSGSHFMKTLYVLKRHSIVKQPANWTNEFASFGNDAGYELPLGVQVVVKDSPNDFFLFLRDYLNSNDDALAEYNHLKMLHARQRREDYLAFRK